MCSHSMSYPLSAAVVVAAVDGDDADAESSAAGGCDVGIVVGDEVVDNPSHPKLKKKHLVKVTSASASDAFAVLAMMVTSSSSESNWK